MESESGIVIANESGNGRWRLSEPAEGKEEWQTCSSLRTSSRAPLIWVLGRRHRRQGSQSENGSGNGTWTGCGPWRGCGSVWGSGMESDHENGTVSERSSQNGNDFST